jgi:hypothetical protein
VLVEGAPTKAERAVQARRKDLIESN